MRVKLTVDSRYDIPVHWLTEISAGYCWFS